MFTAVSGAGVIGGDMSLLSGSGSTEGGDLLLNGGVGSSAGGNVIIGSGSANSGSSGNIELVGSDGAQGGNLVLASGNGIANGGSITVSSGDSVNGVGAPVVIAAGDSNQQSGGDVDIISGSSGSLNGGNIRMLAGSGSSGGSITMSTAEHQSSMIMHDNYVHVRAGKDQGKIVLSVPMDASGGESRSVIGFGLTGEGQSNIDLRIQASNSDSLIIASAPMQVSTISFPDDKRIKQDFADVDNGDILERIKKIRVQTFGYTPEWRKVGNIEDVRVRGVLAQELAEVFPEYVSTIPNYHLEDKNFQMSDFQQVDKTSLIFDTIAALQAVESRFSVARSTNTKSGDVSISSDLGKESSGDVSIQSGHALSGKSGNLNLRTGISEGEAGMISIIPGTNKGLTGGSVVING